MQQVTDAHSAPLLCRKMKIGIRSLTVCLVWFDVAQTCCHLSQPSHWNACCCRRTSFEHTIHKKSIMYEIQNMHYNDLSTDWWWLWNTTQNTQYENWHTSWVITDIEVVMSVKTSNQLMSVYKLINIEVAMSVKYPINWCARTSSLWLTVKFLLLSQFEQQKFRGKNENISHINEYPASLSIFFILIMEVLNNILPSSLYIFFYIMFLK